jgi:hypothetical protein
VRRILSGMLWASTLLAVSTHAQQEAFDRSPEVDRFVRIIETGTRGKLIEAAGEVVDSDLADPKLAAAIHTKLNSDLPQLSSKSAVDKKYRSTMIAALVSTGLDAYLPFIESSCDAPKSDKPSKECTAASEAIRWHSARNRVANTKRSDFRDDELHLARIANLLMADDFAFKEEATTRMANRKIRDDRLFDIIELQLLSALPPTTSLANSLRAAPSAQPQKNYPRTTIFSRYVNLLGQSGNIKYRNTIDAIAKSDAAHNIKKHARTAAKRLSM